MLQNILGFCFCGNDDEVERTLNLKITMTKRKWIVYLVRCADGSLYCGVTNDLKKRLDAHNRGKGAKYTKSRGPVAVVGTSSEMSKSDAMKLEYRVKKKQANRKLSELTKNEENLIPLRIEKRLKGLHKEIQALGKKLEELMDEILVKNQKL